MALHNLNPVLSRHLNDGLARNSIQKTVWQRRMDGAVIHDKKHICTCRLSNITTVIKHQRILKPVLFSLMFCQRANHIQPGCLGMNRGRFNCRTLPFCNFHGDPLHLDLRVKIAGPLPRRDSQMDLCLLGRNGHHL